MKIEIIKNNERFLAIKQDWDHLFKLGNYSVFQSFSFNYHSWYIDLSKNFRNQLAIVMVKKKKEIVAFFPFYVDTKKQLRFINDIHADFCDCISSEKINIQQLFSYLKAEMVFKVISLINIKEDANIKNYLKNIQLSYSLCLPFEKYALAQLQAGYFPNNYSEFKSKQLSVFRRIEKKNNDKTHIVLSVDTQKFPENDILTLKDKMIKLGYRKKFFLTKKQLKLIKQLYCEKHLVLSVVEKDNRFHAISFVLKKSNEYLFWIDMFDDNKMINLFNYISYMRKVSVNESVVVNFGRGAYNYKIVNFKPIIKQLYAVLVFENSIQMYMSQFSDKILKAAKLIYRKIVK